MNSVPTKTPRTPATIVHTSDRPSAGPMNPIGIEKYWKLPKNHSGIWCQRRPWRSSSGTQSIDRLSISRAGGAWVVGRVGSPVVTAIVNSSPRELRRCATVHVRCLPVKTGFCSSARTRHPASRRPQERRVRANLRPLERETQLAPARLPAVERATIHPFSEGQPGPVFYQRYAHPVGVEAERLIGELEGAPALLFPSGMAAITALALALLAPGSRIAVAEGGYYGTFGMLSGELSRWGVEVVGFDQTGPPPPADLVWLGPCGNPVMTFPDLETAISVAHDAGAKVAVDNTVLTPLLLRPLEHGADFVMHSASKILAGHHDALLGVGSCAHSEDRERLAAFRGSTGIVAAPEPTHRGGRPLRERLRAPAVLRRGRRRAGPRRRMRPGTDRERHQPRR